MRMTCAFILALFATLSNVFAAPTTTISGNPSAPATITLNDPYTVNVAVQASSGYVVYGCDLYSGSASSGPWTWKASYGFSGYSGYGNNNFDVVNQASGTYWWRGKGYASDASAPFDSWSSSLGAYTTN